MHRVSVEEIDTVANLCLQHELCSEDSAAVFREQILEHAPSIYSFYKHVFESLPKSQRLINGTNKWAQCNSDDFLSACVHACVCVLMRARCMHGCIYLCELTRGSPFHQQAMFLRQAGSHQAFTSQYARLRETKTQSTQEECLVFTQRPLATAIPYSFSGHFLYGGEIPLS